MSAGDLRNLLDSLTDISIYVIEEETHQLLYFNRRSLEHSRGKAVIGAKCYEVWPELCVHCPLNSMGEKSSIHSICYDPLMKTMVDVTANRIIWEGHIHAVVITVAPHRLNFEEQQGLKKIEKMYAQSLVKVFDECVIVNLTADYYVNCQKDMMWTEIPQQGNFGVENRNYAQRVVHPEDLEQFNESFSREALLGQFREGRKKITRRMRRLTRDNIYHQVEFTAARIEQLGEDECWCVLVFRDIQDEYLLEQQRDVEISQLVTAAKEAYQMLIAVNLSRNTYHMIEYDRYPIKKPGDEGSFEELIERELSTVHPDYRELFQSKFSHSALINAFMRGERIVAMEVPHMDQEGHCHWSFTQVIRVESASTDDLLEITLSRNIDQERQMQEAMLEKERRAKQLLEEALQKAEAASQAKSEFLSRMSHDIRTPMNAILGMTQLAMLNLEDRVKLKDYLEKISGSGTHLLELINEVLDVSKIESGAAELVESEFNLKSLVMDVAEMVQVSAEQKKQTLSVKMDDDLNVSVSGDERRIRQVLVNILENASKYTPAGGNIIFSLEETEQREQNTGTYRFVIRDNGIGMKQEYLKHIFEPFSRADDSRISKIAGTGLGMTIVKNLVSMMGGDIQVESRYGKGSKFQVTLCLTKCGAPAPVTPTEMTGKRNAFAGIRVLLAEDNELNRQIAVERLEILGVKVETVENGREAVEAVCTHPAFYYDLVFMDVQMPELNGYEATGQIRASKLEAIEELPIIAMTADAFAEDVKQARLSGMNGHLAKPISIGKLQSALSDCIAWKKKNGRGRFFSPEE